MFSASKVDRPQQAVALAPWLKVQNPPTRSSFALVAVASRTIIDLLELELRDGLAPRPLSAARGELSSGAGTSDVRVSFRFEADDSQRHALADLVQHVCAIKGVRYLRLDSR